MRKGGGGGVEDRGKMEEERKDAKEKGRKEGALCTTRSAMLPGH